ncbi:protocadherin beta-15 isoform X1 [Octopus bimaculoides]|uniref:Cadherin domain-containing protein n=1 Tax=Octopus bimaculoides TaxID=37653 RepID=A0A0L8H698_OCTBM|nr:protocadherin beta-15 isoform X1 [Octopus bimaculoides]|eukprot:XP_014775153.1 PREDICTED: protocadherin beta-15-like isoform X1 [Octopus bimaculoides]
MNLSTLVGLLLLLFLPEGFTVDLTYHIEEERSPGTFIGDIAADSPLLNGFLIDEHERISFSQLQRKVSGTSQLFNITKHGRLLTAQTLDAEVLCIYNKECSRIIKVAVHQKKTFMKILKIKVIIEDINDHQPEFPVKEVDLHFLESDRTKTVKPIPNVIDKDIGVLNSLIKYELRKNPDEPFSLSVTKRVDGRSKINLLLDEELDREVKGNYTLQIIAKDGGSPPKVGILNVQISVIDVNDNLPIFHRNTFNVSIKSSHNKNKPIITLTATDSDIGENGKVFYHFSPKTLNEDKKNFYLKPDSGEILLKETFVPGQKQTYKLFVEAIDGGKPSLSSTALVLVNVINQQNNSPMISVDFVSAISENSTAIPEDIEVGSFIAYVMVTDDDLGQNGEVTCDLKHEVFKLLSLGSKEFKITLKRSVDREIKDYYHITISCEDQGTPPLKSKRNFSIQVIDVNDVQPQFTKVTYKFLTYENKPPNFPIGFIDATDPDLGPGGELTYSLKDEGNLPLFITKNGFILTTQSLDREQQDVYRFKVFVKDNGVNSLNNTANIIVEVMDENDNAPYFTFPSVSPFSLDIHYYPQSKNDITVLRASDRDSRENAFLRYEIIAGNDKHLFSVNFYTGVLSFSRTVYQNDAGSYDLQFIVKDSGTPVLSATTVVALTLTVSNETFTAFSAVQVQSEDMIDVKLVIIIVVVAVLLSIAIVIFITVTAIRCNNQRNNTAAENQPYQSRTEMKQLIYQTSNPIVLAGNPEEMLNRNTQSMKSKNQFYPEEESQNEWKTSTMVTTLPKLTKPKSKMYQPAITATSCAGEPDVDEMMIMGPSYLSDRDTGHMWSRGDKDQYEEIPAMLALHNYRQNMTSAPNRGQY